MMTRDEVARRAALEIPPGARVRASGPLAELVATYAQSVHAQGIQIVDGEIADVAFIDVAEVSGGGGISVFTSARRVIALLDIERGARFVDEAEPTAIVARANRVICSLGVFDFTADGLVLREVPRAVSAREVQERVPILLRAAPSLAPVRLH